MNASLKVPEAEAEATEHFPSVLGPRVKPFVIILKYITLLLNNYVSKAK